jgi:archaemetzincin
MASVLLPKGTIRIIPITPVDEQLLASLPDPLESAFKLPAAVEEENHLDPSFAYDLSRTQYNSTLLISAFLDRWKGNEGKILGVTSVDLFVPVLTYVFGEAQLDGPIAVVSTYRLEETLYGLPPSPKLAAARLLKEAIHELGHTFGLIHCHEFECVMHSSTAVEEIDLKSAQFCVACEGRLRGKVEEMLPGVER